MRVLDGIGALDRRGELRDRLVDVSVQPQAPGQERPSRRARILSGVARGQLLGLVARIEELDGALDTRPGIRPELPGKEESSRARAAH